MAPENVLFWALNKCSMLLFFNLLSCIVKHTIMLWRMFKRLHCESGDVVIVFICVNINTNQEMVLHYFPNFKDM